MSALGDDHPAFKREVFRITRRLETPTGDLTFCARVAEYRRTRDYRGGLYAELWCLDTEECIDDGRETDYSEVFSDVCRNLIDSWKEELQENGV